ncbi:MULTISPECIES: NCS2 family permease [Pelosinus]|uniref:Xanthine/uracil/vitamin C permease n=1 Tax=Pelosinus fermentans B4 TaxID=1149862 RepID=I8RF10_9FIRM|nr:MULTISPECIES: NCS2 family permease [Pelosinus]EIW16205.1 Xanthine/uracil/vitamin C permease [Pelosinus fermentans B4]EIW22814.1 Xanthine/uracil/vitamin C permease [Pelosinus fermentans A11]OAM95512.1 Xanthine/uracil/vitamin C permease [Pelosinus fermentans DSM 17108]SDR29086.1 putative MFS transporter, AGZA family, xanthine/uracil permease [Pelosinus fermentans]
MDSWFKLEERGTKVSTEIMAGITTFLTMVYIVIVNPAVLHIAGMDFDGVFMATILASALATLIMGVFANYPIAIAPGMGMNAYFSYSVVLAGGHSWQVALGAVFLTGSIFLLLSLTKFRYILIDSIPTSLKHAITAGIGLFISFIGLQNAKIVIASPATLVTLGNLAEPITLMTIIGLVISLVLMVYRVQGALFAGMLITSVIAYYKGMLVLPESLFMLPHGLEKTAWQMNVSGVFEQGLYAVVFTFLLITLFDTTGTMLGVAEQAGLLKDGKFPRVRGALLADAVGTTVGAALGTSPTSAYVESSSGVAVGGRTGLTAVVTAILLLITLFFAPIAKMLASIPAVTAPALIIVGFFMMSGLRSIDWNDLEEAFPAFLIVIAMPLTYSIATGIGVGFIVYPILKVLRGKGRTVHPILYIFAILFFIQLGFFSH